MMRWLLPLALLLVACADTSALEERVAAVEAENGALRREIDANRQFTEDVGQIAADGTEQIAVAINGRFLAVEADTISLRTDVLLMSLDMLQLMAARPIVTEVVLNATRNGSITIDGKPASCPSEGPAAVLWQSYTTAANGGKCFPDDSACITSAVVGQPLPLACIPGEHQGEIRGRALGAGGD